MDYIINPTWFYWLQVISGIKIFFTLVSITAGITLIVLLLYGSINYMFSREYPELELSKQEYNSFLKVKTMYLPLGIILAISILIEIFIPSRDTLISMMIAKYATYANAQLTVDTIKSAVDYIIKSIQSING